MLGKSLRMSLECFNCKIECFFGMRSYFKDTIEKFLRRFAVDSIPYVFRSQIILSQNFLRKKKSIISQRKRNSSDILTYSNLFIKIITAYPRQSITFLTCQLLISILNNSKRRAIMVPLLSSAIFSISPIVDKERLLISWARTWTIRDRQP